MPSQAFQSASAEALKLNEGPTQSERLRLYGLFKIANGTNASKFGMNPGQPYMYAAWKKMKDAGLQPAEAEEQYIALFEELKAKHGLDPTK